jgi:hypothetical protein
MKFKVYLFTIILFLFCLFFSGQIFANEESSIVLKDEVIVTSEPTIKLENIANFFVHLDKHYLDLSKDHKKFVLLNSDVLKQEIYIENEEESGGQYLKHYYYVEKFEVNQEKEILKLVLISKKSKVNTMFLNMDVKVMLLMDASKIALNTYKIESVLAIEFKNGFDLFLANLVNTKGIWAKHFQEELENGRNIIVGK